MRKQKNWPEAFVSIAELAFFGFLLWLWIGR